MGMRNECDLLNALMLVIVLGSEHDDSMGEALGISLVLTFRAHLIKATLSLLLLLLLHFSGIGMRLGWEAILLDDPDVTRGLLDDEATVAAYQQIVDLAQTTRAHHNYKGKAT